MPGDYTGLLALLLLSTLFAALAMGLAAALAPRADAGRRDDFSVAPSDAPSSEAAELEPRLRLLRIALFFACALPAVVIGLLWVGEARAMGRAALPGVLALGIPVAVGLWSSLARGVLRW